MSDIKKSLSVAYAVSRKDKKPTAKALLSSEEAHNSVADAIMAKRQKPDNDVIDITQNAQEEPNQFRKANEEALKENYDDDFKDLEQPMDSNEHGDTLEDSEMHSKSKAERIMARMKSRK